MRGSFASWLIAAILAPTASAEVVDSLTCDFGARVGPAQAGRYPDHELTWHQFAFEPMRRVVTATGSTVGEFAFTQVISKEDELVASVNATYRHEYGVGEESGELGWYQTSCFDIELTLAGEPLEHEASGGCWGHMAPLAVQDGAPLFAAGALAGLGASFTYVSGTRKELTFEIRCEHKGTTVRPTEI